MDFSEFIEKSRNLEYTYRITRDIYNLFQKCSQDMNPLHTNEEYAKSKGFTNCVMYGNILNAFVSHFVGMAMPSPDVMIQTQDIQFRKPVYLEDNITIQSSHEDVSESVEIIKFKLKFYRTTESKKELVASGHVQIGMLHDKQ